jgi:hypothetical protein
MIRLLDLNTAALFLLFVAAGMKIGDKIIDLRFFQDVCEGWHLMTALQYLRADLNFAKRTANSREIRPFGAAVFADGVAVLAAVVCKQCRAVTLVGCRCECRKKRCGCKDKDEPETRQIHWVDGPTEWVGSGAKSV